MFLLISASPLNSLNERVGVHFGGEADAHSAAHPAHPLALPYPYEDEAKRLNSLLPNHVLIDFFDVPTQQTHGFSGVNNEVKLGYYVARHNNSTRCSEKFIC